MPLKTRDRRGPILHGLCQRRHSLKPLSFYHKSPAPPVIRFPIQMDKRSDPSGSLIPGICPHLAGRLLHQALPSDRVINARGGAVAADGGLWQNWACESMVVPLRTMCCRPNSSKGWHLSPMLKICNSALQ